MKSVLTIGYGRGLFDEHNTERTRLEACARVVDGLHMIVFSQKKHQCIPQNADPLFLYPTHSRSRVHMLFDAYRIGSTLLRMACRDKTVTDKDLAKKWIISTQDPFEAGLVCYLLHLRFGIPLQIQEHGDFFSGGWWRRERVGNRLRYVCGRWLLRRAASVRAVSLRVAQHLALIGVDPVRIVRLPVAADVAAFAQRDAIEKTHDLRALYPDAGQIILAVGRLVREKNFVSLIRAFSRVAVLQPNARLVIIGSGPERNLLAKLIEKYDLSARVSIIAWTDDVASYMRSADIFVLCSYREGWGRVIVEAMSAGLPSVVTDVGCVGEVFIDGRHGVVVPVDDTVALEKALQKLASDTSLCRHYSSAAARDIALWHNAQESYAEAWRKTIETCGS